MNKYEVDIYWSAEDAAYLAEAPELPGCLAREEALAKAQEAIQLRLDTAKEFGDPIPEPRGGLILSARPTDSVRVSSGQS